MRPTITGINFSADSIPSRSIWHRGNLSTEVLSTNIIFTCTANGMPLPEIEWLFDGTVLPSNSRIVVDNNMVSTEDRSGGFSVSTLTIGILQLSDRGMYTCRAVSGNVSPIPGQSAVTFELIIMGWLHIHTLHALKPPKRLRNKVIIFYTQFLANVLPILVKIMEDVLRELATTAAIAEKTVQ